MERASAPSVEKAAAVLLKFLRRGPLTAAQPG
jgi:hypothetical protein